jgi:hypothetical protein
MKMSKCNKIHDMTEELLSNGLLHINATLLTISCHLGGSSERLGGWLFLNIGIASFSKNIYRQNEGGIHNHGEYTAQESCAFW